MAATEQLSRGFRSPANWTGGVLVILGILLGIGGAWLIFLGGSFYYLLAGIGLIVSGLLMLQRRGSALWIFALVWLGTLIWAVSEVGFDFWPLAARGDLLVPLGVWLLFPVVVRDLPTDGSRGGATFTWPLWLAAAASLVVLGIGLSADHHDISGQFAALDTTAKASASPDQPNEDWRAYGRTYLGQRFSPLNQITPGNVGNLKVAWTFRTGDGPGTNDPVETTFEVTPLKIANTLYLCSQHQRVFALDARTGAQRWSFDPQLRDNPTFQHLTCRGVSYFEKPGATDCPRRIFLPVNDGRMIALDADTGKPCTSFANQGTLDLQEGMGVRTAGFYEPTSPPVIGDSVLVVGGAVIDNYSSEEPSGVIRGFDAETGKLIWAWDSGAADENALASPTHNYSNNSPNSWITASFDPDLHLIYLPMGVKTPDIWGGNRTALEERYSSALVALDIRTGKLSWSYQTVHHDLWDNDVPSQPSLVDVDTAHGRVPAVVVPTKTGNLFVLDRRNGQLVVPAPERPVPQGAATGDHVSPTQPFSALTFRPEDNITGADMWGATLIDQMVCRILFQKMRYEGTFTPPSLQGTLVYPGNLGMFEWGGVAIDPVNQIAIANPISMPFVSKLLPRGPDNPAAPNDAHPPGSEIGVQPMYGTPYGVVLHPFLSPIGLPCLRPPWGYIAGIDLKTMKIVWQHRNGTIRDSAPLPIPIKMGVPSLGGPLTTAGGVAFLTSTSDYYIRAYDVRSGAQLWQDRLPAGGQSTPMSYAVDGTQYVVTAAGGHGSFGTKTGDYVIAYALAN
jgi:quinoprotein glucose dehydrogenase